MRRIGIDHGGGGDRPDPMQRHYARASGTGAPGEPWDVEIDGEPLPPIPSVSIRWGGLIVLVGAIAIVAMVSRSVSVRAAELLGVGFFLVLAFITIARRHGFFFWDYGGGGEGAHFDDGDWCDYGGDFGGDGGGGDG